MSTYLYHFDLKTDLSEVNPLKVRSISINCDIDEFYETFEHALQFKELNDLTIYLRRDSSDKSDYEIEIPETISKFKSLTQFSFSSNYRINNIKVTLPDVLFEFPSIGVINVNYAKVVLPEKLQKPSFLYQLTLDEVLNLPCIFDDLPNLMNLKLNATDTSSLSLPSSINNCEKLQSLQLEGFIDQEIPFEFDRFTSLRVLNLSNFPNLKTLPESIASLGSINSLSLKRTSVPEIPEGFGDGLFFNNIHLEGNQITCLPESIYNASVNQFTIENNKFTVLDFRVFNLGYLQKLTISEPLTEITNADPNLVKDAKNLSIDLKNTSFDVLPSCFQLFSEIKSFSIRNGKKLDCTGISKIKKIEYLKISNFTANSKEEILSIKNCKNFTGFKGNKTMHSDSPKFFAALISSSISIPLKEKIINVIQKKEALDHLSIHELLCSSTVNNKEWQMKVDKVLQKRISEQLDVPLNKNSNLFVMGKLSSSKTEFKDKFSPYFSISNRFNDKVTHIVLGRLPKEALKLEEEKLNKKFITESDLTDYINTISPGYIIEEANNDSQISENIKSLLYSDDESSQLLALEMLNTGGIPKDIINELFFIQKTTSNNSIRKATAKVLKANAPNEMLTAVNDRSGLKGPEKFEEYELFAKFKKLSKNWGVEVASQLAYSIYQKYNKGLRYVVVFGKKTTLWEKVIPIFLEDGILDWTKALGYRKRTDVPDEQGSFFNAHRPLPNEVLKNHKVTHLILNNSKQGRIEESISEYVDLEVLDLSYNDLMSLPYSISELSKLKELDLKYNFSMSTLPKGIYDLPSLEKLHISDHVEFNEEIFKSKLPNCQIIKYESSVTISQ
ncbi:leucine-rich repeat domain-containing protein [Flammeovirga sp. SJP92]|uniref:leucine-rich repeat domain-containing protein n=1 Tax=Flammeovirga sp. SJP92 TaxID=1775430 RepID=UPI0007873668|nr:hypothetical protein [Flammeovirga sp. SJP92]KXX70469.1 hypothetical protein AVL50_08915 [Flammeovirga sp. SJP92]